MNIVLSAKLPPEKIKRVRKALPGWHIYVDATPDDAHYYMADLGKEDYWSARNIAIREKISAALLDIENLTGVQITLAGGRVIPPSSKYPPIEARPYYDREPWDIAGVQSFRYSIELLTPMPPPDPGVVYVVSPEVLAALSGERSDVYAVHHRENGEVGLVSWGNT